MKRVLVAIAFSLVLLTLPGCSLRILKIPEIQNVKVSTLVKTKPLQIGNQAGTTQVSLEDFSTTYGQTIDPNTGEVRQGDASDVIYTYDASDVPLPSDLQAALTVDVEAIQFEVDFGAAATESHPMALTITAPSGEHITLSANVQNGNNTLSLTPETREALSNLLESYDNVSLQILVGGELAEFDISNLQIQAAVNYSTPVS